MAKLSYAEKLILYQEALECLTSKQKIFVQVFDGNGTKACRDAGYKEHEVESFRLLRNPKIKRALALKVTKRDKKVAKKILDKDERQQFWTKIIQDESQEIKARLRASELLGKSFGDFLDKVEINVNHTISVAEAITQADVQSVKTIDLKTGKALPPSVVGDKLKVINQVSELSKGFIEINQVSKVDDNPLVKFGG